jgi:hypothetical protein
MAHQTCGGHTGLGLLHLTFHMHHGPRARRALFVHERWAAACLGPSSSATASLDRDSPYLLLHPERPYSIQHLCPFPSKRAQRSVRDLVLILHRLAGSLTRSILARCRRRGAPFGRLGRRRRQWWRHQCRLILTNSGPSSSTPPSYRPPRRCRHRRWRPRP